MLSKLSSLVPARTSPLTKFIRTTEGVLVVLFNAACVVAPIVTSAVGPTEALKAAGLVNMVTVVSRTGLKIFTALGVPETVTEANDVQEIGTLSSFMATAIPELTQQAPPLESSAKAAPVAAEA